MNDREANKLVSELGLGAQGTHSQGKVNEHDQGDLKAALTIENGKLVLVFGKPVTWVAMTKHEAFALCDLIRRRAQEM